MAHSIEDALENKTKIDGSSVYGMTSIDHSDLVLMPDLNSYRRLPLFDSEFGNVSVMMCFVANPDGTPANGCSRYALKQALEEMEKKGFSKLNIGFEPEFFLLKRKPESPSDVAALLDLGTYADAEGENDVTAHIRREIMFELDRAGIIPLLSHHERAPSSCEIPYKYSDAMTSCDNLILGMHITKTIAKKHGLYATFEPKPFDSMNGNGLHTNISLSNHSGNAFAKDEGLSNTAKHFLAGVLKHASALCFLTNPGDDSYRRLIKGYEAPVSICWGYTNRSAMIRVPSATGLATRMELRSPDSNMNPYLGVAGILIAGLDGITNDLILSKPIDFDAGLHENEIPTLPADATIAKQEFMNSTLFHNSRLFQLF